MSKILSLFSKGPDTFKQDCISQAKKFDINNVGKQVVSLYFELDNNKEKGILYE